MHCVQWKTGHATTWNANFYSDDKYNHSYMKSWLILLKANLVQVPCKMKNAMHNGAKKQIFLDLKKKWDTKAKGWFYNPQTLQTHSSSTQAKY